MKQVNIGILGLGTVGSAVAEVLRKNAPAIAEKTGIKIAVKKVCDIKRKKTAFSFTADPGDIIKDHDISIMVEAIGGVNPAKRLVLAALAEGKHVVTSNKELIALHMDEILSAAAKNGVSVLFEGSVGGGIPILAALRDNLSANRISEVYGIVNGTTNYILSKMAEEGKEFSEVLKEAQKKGFAEANPKLDIEGYDASYKAAILASVAFGAKVKWNDVYREGIEKVTSEDILYAGEIGYAVKLLAVAKMVDQALEVRVHPALVPINHPLANVAENFNAVYVKGFPVGELMFYGPGAGGNPTASAVISDIIQVASSKSKIQNSKLRNLKIKGIGEIKSRYYIRLQAPDRYGVLAGISKAFADKKVSIAAVTQKETVGDTSTIVILLHEVAEQNLKAALAVIGRLPVVRRVGNVIRIL
jgi:homoserine dehydrogenase